jgi:hypothetical protein
MGARLTDLSLQSIDTYLVLKRLRHQKGDLSPHVELELAVTICRALHNRVLQDDSTDPEVLKAYKWVDKKLSRNAIWTNSAILLAALISCGLGISAFRWSKDNLTPLLIKFRNQSIIGLLPNSVAQITEKADFSLFEAAKIYHERYGLLARWQREETEVNCVCLFPLSIELE